MCYKRLKYMLTYLYKGRYTNHVVAVLKPNRDK